MEENIFERMRQEAATKSTALELAEFEKNVKPAIVELQGLLDNGDQLSLTSMENIVKWKLGEK